MRATSSASIPAGVNIELAARFINASHTLTASFHGIQIS